MIIFDLVCDSQHEFEGWFENSQELVDQQASGILTCPVCHSGQVRKLVSIPKVGKKANSSIVSEVNDKQRGVNAGLMSESSASLGVNKDHANAFNQMQSMLKKMHDYVECNFKDVGNKFAEEAISMHKGEKESANICGIASQDQLRNLAEEGVTAVPLPAKPIDKDKLN